MAAEDTSAPDEGLRLVALDEDDLAIVSAHAQDAVLKIADLTWLPREARFVMAMNRFVPDAGGRGLFRRPQHQRRRSVLDFSCVAAARHTGFDRGRTEDVLSLLAIRFEPGEAPSGTVELIFAGDATIRLDVECIEARLTDLGPAWATDRAPRHPAD